MRIDAISGAGRADRGRVHANSRRLAGVYSNGRSGGRRAELDSPLERWHCPGGGVRTRLRVGGIALAYLSNWPTSFWISVLSALAYGLSLLTGPMRMSHFRNTSD